ncbi:host cell division inhibitor Icd-like protein [Escherichia coli]|nr:host cell division inhibitor Icd-like protein [Escherichia coli]MBS8961647.1 host cell division inhibitor Icd-like protein [Escherichia coli]
MNMPDILKPAVRYIDTADKFALLNINHADYMRHIVSHFAAERMKHVKQYLREVLSNYRAGGPVRREYPHDAGMAGKTKATTKGSPVEIKEIKRIIHNAISEAGGQYAVYDEWPLGPDVRIFLRHVLFRKLSSAKASGASLCSRARALSSLRVNSVALACSRAAFRFRSCSVIRALVSVTIMAKEFFFWSSISYPLLLDRLECCFKKSSSAKLVLKVFSNRLRISISAMCLVIDCFFSTKCCSYAVRSSFLFSDCEVCCVLSILCTCKTMRRTSSHHGADGFCLFHRAAEETASYQPGGRFLVAFNRRGYFSIKSSRANRFCGCFFTPGRGVNSSGSDISLARFSSSWRSSMRCKSCLRCSAKISVMDWYFLFMLLPCKAMRPNTPRYSDDGFCCCNLLRWFFLPLRNTSSGGGSLVFSGGVNFSCLVSMMSRISRWRCSALIFGVTGENLCLLILDSGNALCRDASYHGAGYFLVRCLSFWYPSFLEGYVNIFRTNFSRNTSDHLSKKAAYTEAIPYKTGIGRENPFNCKAINDARSVFFSASALRHINGIVYCAYSCTIQSFHELHFAQRHQQTMVMLAGLPKGRPESLQSGFLTPASVTALCERENSCGDVIHHCKEAANMATIPALVHSQTAFIWRFIIFGASESQIINVTAWTEREARNRCPSGCVAVFAARIRQEVTHA